MAMGEWDVDRGLEVLRQILGRAVPASDAARRRRWDQRLRDLAEPLRAIAVAMEFRRYETGSPFIREGSRTPDGVWIVLSGRVRVQAKAPAVHAGERAFRVEKVVPPPGAGEAHPFVMGLIGLVDQGPRTASCAADGPVEAVYVSRDAMHLVLDGSPELRSAFRYLLARQLVSDARDLSQRVEAAIQAAARA
jgi:CRP-like cAMP-binding protein